MKPILLLLFSLMSGIVPGQTVLKAGTYRHLKPTAPLVLDTGSFTFIGLEMKDLGEGVWVDGCHAGRLTFLDCRFEGRGKGTALHTRGHLVMEQCRITNLEEGIHIESEGGTTLEVQIVRNVFSDLGTAISLGRANLRIRDSSSQGIGRNTMASGVYSYRLFLDGAPTGTKKLVVAK